MSILENEKINQNNTPVNPNAHAVLRIYHPLKENKDLVLEKEIPFDEHGNKHGVVVEYDENSNLLTEQVFMRGHAGPLKHYN